MQARMCIADIYKIHFLGSNLAVIELRFQKYTFFLVSKRFKILVFFGKRDIISGFSPLNKDWKILL
jgi:hypothetical protein